jgi:hypothetical protein
MQSASEWAIRDRSADRPRERQDNEKLSDAFAKLSAEHQAVKDKLARLKKRPPRDEALTAGIEHHASNGLRVQKMPGTRAGHSARREAY